MRASMLLCLPAVVLLCCFVCRAQDSTTIRGNWQLIGLRDSHPENLWLTASLGVDGDKVLGGVHVGFRCPNNVGFGSALDLKGGIALDGTFLLTDSNPKVPYTITIGGKIPQSGSEQWPGTYSFSTESARGKCSMEGNFIATKLPPLSGGFSGSLQITRTRQLTETLQLPDMRTFPLEDHPGEVIVTVDISQSDILSVETPTGSLGQVPLQATMTLSGSDLFPSGKLTSVTGQIYGDCFRLHFSGNHGEQIMLGSDHVDASTHKIQAMLTGGVNVIAGGSLTPAMTIRANAK